MGRVLGKGIEHEKRPVVAEDEHGWQPVGVDSRLERSPSSIPAVPHHGGHLDLLPLEFLPWPDFETLQWRILYEVEGLRHAQIYGDPGQRQLGLDIIALAADDSGVALQSKRVRQFGPAKITAAVDAFRNTKRPFEVSRFILGVSREVRSAQALNRFRQHQRDLRPVEFELWDKRVLSYKLRAAPRIVIEFFGNDIAAIFCDPFTISPRVVPRREAVAIRQAIACTPEKTTGAGDKVTRARALADDDPAAALAHIEAAQTALIEAGFAGHAAQHEGFRSSLLLAVGRGTEATRRRLDQLWLALDQGQTTLADIANQEIRSLAAQINEPAARGHLAVADCAVRLYVNPLASLPAFNELMIGDELDRARLTALAGETALAAANIEWLKKSATKILNLTALLADDEDNEPLRTRLRILSAEGSGRWAPLLGDARAFRLGYDLGALVQARYARHLALRQRFLEADAAWDEAAGSACLAERWTDAARWIFCRRSFRGRWRPFTADELLPVQTAISAFGPDATVLTRDEDALEYAYGRLSDEKLRPAAIAAQRALRDAVTLSDWEGERRARRLLAEVLKASGEHQMAASHLVLAGEVSALKQLGADQSAQFLDVTAHLKAEPWWIVGAAYRLLVTQADLIPDEAIGLIAGSATADLRGATNGTLIDLPAFAGSRYLGAIAVLAGIAERLSEEHAEEVLTFFEAQPPVELNHYRYQDEDEAKTVAGILIGHPDLTTRALRHLVALLARSQVSRDTKTLDAVTDRLDQARPQLERLAAEGDDWAREVLNSEHPEEASAADVQLARLRLEEPLVHVPGVMTFGSGSRSLPDSVLVRSLPVREQQASLEELLGRAADPYVSAIDRASYLVAASNLRPPTNRTNRAALLDRALGLVRSPVRSEADEAEAPYRNPLSAVRLNRDRDTRGQAVHLAATLAKTRKEKQLVRAAALGLVGDEAVSEVWVTRALQRLGDTMAPDVGFLSGQNWALKSLSAILWSKTTEPEPVGYRLAADADPRVRRVLAMHLVQNQANEFATSLNSSRHDASVAATRRSGIRVALIDLLREDPCFSVRSAAAGAMSTALPAAKS